jgi:protein-tyrosine phosphatase
VNVKLVLFAVTNLHDFFEGSTDTTPTVFDFAASSSVYGRCRTYTLMFSRISSIYYLNYLSQPLRFRKRNGKERFLKDPNEMKKRLLEEFGLEGTTNEDGETIDNKQILQMALINSRMIVRDGLPCRIPGFDFLYIGSLGAAYNLNGLRSTGITHILCLSMAIKIKYPDQFEYKRLSVVDKPDFDISQVFGECLNFIENTRQSNGKVLVHCYQGISRSATIVCAYLIQFHQMSFITALETVRAGRPQAGPNAGFILQLRRLERQVLGQNSIPASTVVEVQEAIVIDHDNTKNN